MFKRLLAAVGDEKAFEHAMRELAGVRGCTR
jgi:hypothetical protein